MPLLIVLVLWLMALFMSFGLFMSPNTTVVASLLLSALSVLENCGDTVWAISASTAKATRDLSVIPYFTRDRSA